MPEKQSTGMMPELNWMRGIGAMMIMLYHHTTRYQELVGHLFPWQFHLPWGCDAVSLFFVLSGFLTVWTLSERTKAITFAKKRVLRIYPMYWVAILVTSMAMPLLLPEKSLGIGKILGNFLIFHKYLGIPSVDGAYWTLAVEMLFYIYVFLVLLLKWQNGLKWLLLLGTGVSAVYLFGFSGTEQTLVAKLLGFAVMDQYGILFFAGGFLAGISKDKKDYVNWCGLAACLLLSVLHHRAGYLWMLLIFTGVILVRVFFGRGRYGACLEKLDRYLPLSYLARISFPLYLTHQNIGRGIIRKMEQAGADNEFLILLVTCGICILLADVLHRCVG